MLTRTIATRFLVPVLLSSALLATLVSQEPKVTDDEAALQAMVTEFSRCIREKDWEAFEVLFLDEDTPWVGVIGAEARGRAEARGMLDENGLFRVSRATFQEQIEQGTETSDEVFENLEVVVDEGLAWMKADYEFLSGTTVLNHGVETWDFVKTKTGWKIVSVLYSLNPGPR